MDIKSISSNIVTQQQTKKEKPKDDAAQSETLKEPDNSSTSSDSVNISHEAQALYGEGGAHPERPVKTIPK
jgi:hypothetical protein